MERRMVEDLRIVYAPRKKNEETRKRGNVFLRCTTRISRITMVLDLDDLRKRRASRRVGGPRMHGVIAEERGRAPARFTRRFTLLAADQLVG